MLLRTARAPWGAPLAVVVALVLLALGTPTCADILVLRDGNAIPKAVQVKPGEVPSDEEIDGSKDVRTDLAYDVVKAEGKDVPAGQVVDVYVTAAEANSDYKDGETRASSGFWADAADSYAKAAEELKGSAKQMALYKHVMALANLGDVDRTLQAADAMLGEFPKSFFLGPVQQKRALVYASKGKLDDAVAALKIVTDAPNMNARDLFEAEYTKLWLTKMIAARTAGDYAAAEKEFRALAEAIDKNPRGKADAGDQRMKSMARVGKALILQNKGTEARKVLEDVLASATRQTEQAALAATYTARGDVNFTAAKEAQSGGKKDDAKKLLDDAVSDYTRVVLMYAEAADASDVFNAKQNLARVYRSLFQLSGEKDCEVAAQRAYDYYRQASDMLDPGEEKRTLVREGMSLKEAMDRACKKAEPAAGAEPEKPAGG